MNLVRAMRRLFGPEDHWRFAGVAFLVVLSGFFEAFGIGLLLPYIAVLQDPSRISTNRYLRQLYEGLGFESHRAFLVAVSIAFLLLIVAKGLFALGVNNLQLRFVFARQIHLGRRLIAAYLHRPYEFFLTSNSSTLISNLTTSLGQFGGVMQSTMMLISELAVTLALVGFLAYLSPIFSIIAVVFVGERDLAIGEVEETAVGERNAVAIAAQVVHYRLGAR